MRKAYKKQESLIQNQQEFELADLKIVREFKEESDEEKYDNISDELQSFDDMSQCRIENDNNVLMMINSNEAQQHSNSYCPNLCIFILFCLTLACNLSLIYFIFAFYANTRDSMLLLYITAIIILYLPLCGIFQSFMYPQHKITMNELQCFMDELLSSYPKISMCVIGNNLFVQNEEKNKFLHQKWHSNKKNYSYQKVEDVSSNFILPKSSKCACQRIIELNVVFSIQCGDEYTLNDYMRQRDEFMANCIKTKQHKLVQLVSYVDVDAQPLKHRFLSDFSIAIGECKQFWMINDESIMVKCFINDATYWIFCILLLSQ